jgi:anti-sigma-K factor RskA
MTTRREKMIVLAGRYVLGLLSKQEAAAAERRMESDPQFRSLVAEWRDRLAELNNATESVEAPSDLWERIRRQLKQSPDDDPAC